MDEMYKAFLNSETELKSGKDENNKSNAPL